MAFPAWRMDSRTDCECESLVWRSLETETHRNGNVLEFVPASGYGSKSCGNEGEKGPSLHSPQGFTHPDQQNIPGRRADRSMSVGVFPYNWQSRSSCPLGKKLSSSSAQIVLFPSGEPLASSDSVPATTSSSTVAPSRRRLAEFEVVLTGSYRRVIQGLRRIHEELSDL